MKKNLLIILLVVLVSVVLFLTYNTNQKLTVASEEAEVLKVDLASSEATKDGLEEALVLLKEKVSTANTQLDISNTALKESQDQIQAIDDQLRGDGSISEKIKALEDENEQWREQLNELSMDLSEIQAQETDTSASQEVTISDLEEIQNFIDKRIQVLAEAVSNLSKLSVERIMVEQEINFLEETMNSVKEVQDLLDNE